MNLSGKVLTVFLVIIAILLISLTAVSVFFFQKEVEKRQDLELILGHKDKKTVELESELVEVKKKVFLLEEKNKEADERINNLLDELELEEGLREEMKVESLKFKEKLEAEIKIKEQLQKELAQGFSASEKKTDELRAKLKEEVDQRMAFAEQVEILKRENETLKGQIHSLEGSPDLAVPSVKMPEEESAMSVQAEDASRIELEEIVVNPQGVFQGRILSVDKETEFVIINLGEKDGVSLGNILAVYRGDSYLGDIRITRVQSEMSAADLIPPFSSRVVRKNDQVVRKQ